MNIIGPSVSKRGIPLATERRAGTQTAGATVNVTVSPTTGAIVGNSADVLRIFSVTFGVDARATTGTDGPFQLDIQYPTSMTPVILATMFFAGGFETAHISFPLGVELESLAQLEFVVTFIGATTRVLGDITASFTRTKP